MGVRVIHSLVVVVVLQVLIRLCASEDVVLSLSNRRMNRIELHCRTSTAGRDNWTFWVENSITSFEILDQADSSITVAVNVTVTTEGTYFCHLDNQRSNPLGPFTTDPNSSPEQDVSFYHVGIINSDVLLANPIPIPNGNTLQFYSITWKNGTSHVLNDPTKYLMSPNGSLTVRHLNVADSGNYSLRIAVSNPIVNGTFVFATNRYFIYVQESPRFINEPTDVIKIISKSGDDNEMLHCEASGFPNVSIHWKHNGIFIQKYGDKYSIRATSTARNRIASTLLINSLNASDNGNVSCKVEIQGCDVNKSYNYCVQNTSSVTSTSSISVITDSFSYDVRVVDGGNLQLRIDLQGNIIPVPIRVYIKYIEDMSGNEEEIISTQTNMDLVILLYISKENIPYSRFNIKVALGTDTVNSNLYKAPLNNRIIDIAKDDILCNIIPWILGIIAVVITGLLLIILVVIIFAVIITRFTIKKIKMKNNHETEMCLISRLPEEKIEPLLKKFLPQCYNSTDICSDGDADNKSIQPPVGLIHWMNETDSILMKIQDKDKKRSLMKLLVNAIHAEDWLEHDN